MFFRSLFRGGVHPPENKDRTAGLPSIEAPRPASLVVPFAQHIGKPALPIVKVNSRVKRGQLLAEHAGYVSAGVHAPASGTVKAIVQTRHPVGMIVDAVRIDLDPEDEWDDSCRLDRSRAEIESIGRDAIRALVTAAGIVGMGGAAFPSHVKLSPPADKPIEWLILNGVECEPHLACDHRLMLENPREIILGSRLFMRAVEARRGVVIGIEANKPDARQALDAAIRHEGLADEIQTRLLPVRYPQGAEKQLIQALLGREVPSGGLPADVGVVVHNVASAQAGFDAVAHGRPLTERIVTVTGPCVARPANYRARIGTPAQHLLDHAGFDSARCRRLLAGGPMMGLAQCDSGFVVVKGLGGILALDKEAPRAHGPCIRCGRCVDACPTGLLPCALSILGETNRLAEAGRENARDCIECGACSYVCPAKRPILHWIRAEKAVLAGSA